MIFTAWTQQDVSKKIHQVSPSRTANPTGHTEEHDRDFQVLPAQSSLVPQSAAYQNPLHSISSDGVGPCTSHNATGDLDSDGERHPNCSGMRTMNDQYDESQGERDESSNLPMTAGSRPARRPPPPRKHSKVIILPPGRQELSNFLK